MSAVIARLNQGIDPHKLPGDIHDEHLMTRHYCALMNEVDPSVEPMSEFFEDVD